MSGQIIKNLKAKLEEELDGRDNVDPNVKVNKIKEILQYYVLNFIYHHPEYGKWIMYGGSALRIIHGLDRMSVDLDFEISLTVTEKLLEELKKDAEAYFSGTYGADADFLTIKITSGRGLILKFNVGKELNLGYPSNFVHVKIDLNNFFAPKTVIERQPINRGQFSFVILTYNMGALMASKIAAIFLRESRGVEEKIYDYKGRDIYDLLWYMGKKAVPDFDYLMAKKVDIKDPKELFNNLTENILNYEKMDDCLKDDLAHLFENPFQFSGWFEKWRKIYLDRLKDYKIRTVKDLESWGVEQNFDTGSFSFIFWYKTEKEEPIKIVYNLSEYWVKFREGDLLIEADKRLGDKLEFFNVRRNSGKNSQEKLKKYATLFHEKTENYFKKTNHIMLGDVIETKVIRMTADKLNLREEILLDKSALLSRELDDLLK